MRLEERAHRALPTGAQCRDAQGALQRVGRMRRPIEQGVHLGDGHAFGTIGELVDAVAGPDVALLDDPEIESRTPVGHQEGRHLGIVEAQPDPVAGEAGLRDLENPVADAVAVADAVFIVGQPLDRQVLSEYPGRQVGAPELQRPIAVRVELIHHDGPLLAAMPGEIALAVAREVEATRDDASDDGRLPNRGADDLATPRDVTRQPDIDGNHDAHLAPPGLYPARGVRGMKPGTPVSTTVLKRIRVVM